MKVTSTHRLQLFVLPSAIRLFAATIACAFVVYCPDAQASPSAYSIASAGMYVGAYPYNNSHGNTKSIGPIYDLPVVAFYDAERDTEGVDSAFGSAAASTSLYDGGVAAASAICQATQDASCNGNAGADLIYFVRAKLIGAQPPFLPTDFPMDIRGRGLGLASGVEASWNASLTSQKAGVNTVTSVQGCAGLGCSLANNGQFYIGDVFIIAPNGGTVELIASVSCSAGGGGWGGGWNFSG